MASTEELNGLLVLGKIRNSIARITREDDRRTASLLHAAFRPDAATDFSVSSRSSDGYRAWALPGSSARPVTQPGETIFGKGASA